MDPSPKNGAHISQPGQLGELPHLRPVFTIGTNGLSAKDFFRLLKTVGVSRLVDIRRRPNSAFGRFATQRDLPYFLQLHQMSYSYLPAFAPSDELLTWYKQQPKKQWSDPSSLAWREYVTRFNREMVKKRVLGSTHTDVQSVLHGEDMVIVLLCTEENARVCHRSLVANLIAYWHTNVVVQHLTTQKIAQAHSLEQGETFCVL